MTPSLSKNGRIFSLGGSFGLIALLATTQSLAGCADDPYVSFDSSGAGDSQTPVADAGPAGDIYVNPCAPDPPPSVSGKVFAPNGVDPVAGASVHVPLALYPIPTSVQCESCAVRGKFTAHTYADADGSFKLEGVPEGTFKVGIQKGYFRRIVEVTVPKCGHVELPPDKTTLPGKNKQYGPFDTIPNIAVVTGAWDKMEKVLDKLGVEEMTIFNGRDYGTGPQSMQSLVTNAGRLKGYHLVLINCGTKFENLVTQDDAPARYALRSYVKAGGRLFVTDYSYDYVEQVFPSYIDFQGSDSTAEAKPEDHNAAEVGTKDLAVWADIQDSDLEAWLDLPEIQALGTNQQVEITGFMTGWAVQKEANPKLPTKVWARGEVQWAGGKDIRPLTTSFEFFDTDNQGCGRVVFSSYHTHGEAAELLPQERILEYLLLEIGTCIKLD